MVAPSVEGIDLFRPLKMCGRVRYDLRHGRTEDGEDAENTRRRQKAGRRPGDSAEVVHQRVLSKRQAPGNGPWADLVYSGT